MSVLIDRIEFAAILVLNRDRTRPIDPETGSIEFDAWLGKLYDAIVQEAPCPQYLDKVIVHFLPPEVEA